MIIRAFSSFRAAWPAGLLALVGTSALRAAPAPVDYTVQLDVIRSGFDGVHCWVHPRAGIVPQPDGRPPSVVLTLQTLWLKGSDVFGPLKTPLGSDPPENPVSYQ